MLPDIDIYDDAWVFLLEGSNSVADYYVRRKSVPTASIDGWNRILRARMKYCNEIGAKYIHIVAPEKLGIYSDKTTLDVQINSAPVSQIQSGLDEDLVSEIWINPSDFLRAQKSNYKVYSKTDSHWNFFGAYSSYQLIQSKLGLLVNAKILNSSREEKWSTMDLGGKFDPPLQEKVHYYSMTDNVQRTYANPIVEYKESIGKPNEVGLHVGSHVRYENSDPLIDKKVIIFGDSFSEYRGHLLTGMFAETYAEVNFIWNSSLDKKFITKLNPDVVITELAERFMPKTVPSDQFCLTEYENKLISRYVEQSAA